MSFPSSDKTNTKNVLLSMYSTVSDSVFTVAEHVLEIGCIKSNVQTRKVFVICYLLFVTVVAVLIFGHNDLISIFSFSFQFQSCDFTFENTKEAFEKGFSIEPQKVSISSYGFSCQCQSIL